MRRRGCFVKKEIPLFVSIVALIFFVSSGQREKPAPAPEKLPEVIVPSVAEILMTTLAAAYPEQIGPAEFRDGDWAFLLGEKWFYYSEGRIIPEEARDRAAEYGSLNFYGSYPAELPSSEQLTSTSTWMRGNFVRRLPGKRPQYFFEALWGIGSRVEAEQQMKQIMFLDHEVKVHNAIVGILGLVEKEILAEAETNAAVSRWVNSLGTVDAWNWRNVANSGNRSFHSYGIAIDILPKNLGGKATYWQWTAQRNPDWRNVPYSDRYHPPHEVIQIFESAGFIWGGKWLYYDTMHFEYRPEVFLLNGISWK